jgi:hypothetical protein
MTTLDLLQKYGTTTSTGAYLFTVESFETAMHAYLKERFTSLTQLTEVNPDAYAYHETFKQHYTK